MADTPEAIRKSIRIYKIVGLILFVGTVVTFAVATQPILDFGRHGFDMMDAILGLGIAATKALLVAAIFMHLNHEKKAIYWIFGLGIILVIAMFGLTALAKSDPIHDPLFYGGRSTTPAPLASPTLR